MDKKTILIDVDGVIAHTMEKTIDLYNKRGKNKVKLEDLQEYDLHKNSGVDKSIYDIFREKFFFRNLKIDQAAKKIIKKLHDEGYDIIFSTAVLKEGYTDRHEWLQEHFPYIPDNNYMLGSRKDLLKGDVMIDDSPENLLNSSCEMVFCMDRPWNRSLKDKKIVRVFSFDDIYNYIKEKDS